MKISSKQQAEIDALRRRAAVRALRSPGSAAAELVAVEHELMVGLATRGPD